MEFTFDELAVIIVFWWFIINIIIFAAIKICKWILGSGDDTIRKRQRAKTLRGLFKGDD